MTTPSWRRWWGTIADAQKHLTSQQAKAWSQPACELFFYDGNDAAERSFTLSFEPKFLPLCAGDAAVLSDMSAPNITRRDQGAAGQNGKATAGGVAASGKTLTVYNDADGLMAQVRRKLNAKRHQLCLPAVPLTIQKGPVPGSRSFFAVWVTASPAGAARPAGAGR